MKGDDDNEIDFLVLGTGPLPSSIACALSCRDKKVLILDTSSHYGEIFGSLRINTFDEKLGLVKGINVTSVYKCEDFESICSAIRGPSYIDIVPAVFHSVCHEVQTIACAKMSCYVSLKKVSPVEILRTEPPGLVQIPTSRRELFRSRDFAQREKHLLMRLLNLFGDYFQNEEPEIFRRPPRETSQLADAGTWGERRGFPPGRTLREIASTVEAQSAADIFARAIGLPDGDATTEATYAALARFFASVGRFSGPNDTSFLLTPMYGCSDLSQAMSRFVSIRGSICAFGNYVSGARIDGARLHVAFRDGEEVSVQHIIAPAPGVPFERPLRVRVSFFRFARSEPRARIIALDGAWALVRSSSVVPRGFAVAHLWEDPAAAHGVADLAAANAQLLAALGAEPAALIFSAEYSVDHGDAVCHNTVAAVRETLSSEFGSLLEDPEPSVPITFYNSRVDSVLPFNAFGASFDETAAILKKLKLNVPDTDEIHDARSLKQCTRVCRQLYPVADTRKAPRKESELDALLNLE
eukprot:gnl/Chilomastix_cuspidata/1293.p1 GENE.gnl/Chilomastix_cuspidata/1293~~gnl/Chilomastix_cuspidata/1293.p1  ORF type:complete len:525 (+),score=132.83 gnl/Chilomastix_cuspidata/1293:182-1756(+)